MDKLDQYRVFVQVAEMGSFIRAAHALQLPRASVSAAVQQLEARMGTRLLHRSTRQVRVTPDGETLLDRLRTLLADSEEIEQIFQSQHRQVSGRLNVDVPSRIARRLLAPALPALLGCHPDLRIALGSTDRAIDLVQEGVDCAVRVGTVQDSSLVVRPIGRLALVNCASPAYLREHGVPADAAALARSHIVVGYASPATGRELPWEFADGDDVQPVELPSRVIVNNAESYIACCRAGLGLIQVPRFDVQHLLAAGELVEVLPECRAPPMKISIVYPHRRQRSARLMAFFEWFETLVQPHLA
ncbi:MAG TPA: LysR family transcriptional regulator [Burkholderiaceae bacterium]|jgi:DNA-binding transcriptional LysR family regulator|nr:LysR family transcriptional regulator [Burkholderiaceae bacterium]